MKIKSYAFELVYAGPSEVHQMAPADAFNKTCVVGRLPELEKVILADPYWSFRYARDIIKGRWVEAEDIIMTATDHSYYYAFCVTKGKLPDKMHNMMLLRAIEDSNNSFVKEYFEFIK